MPRTRQSCISLGRLLKTANCRYDFYLLSAIEIFIIHIINIPWKFLRSVKILVISRSHPCQGLVQSPRIKQSKHYTILSTVFVQ